MNDRRTGLQVRKRAGFSLVELMVVVAIAAILMGMAAPSFRELIQNQRLTTSANNLFAAINLARSEAIKRGARVDLAPVAGTGEWNRGWAVFIDADMNQKPGPGEEIIFSQGPIPRGINITSNRSGSPVQFLSYNGAGRAQMMSFSFSFDGLNDQVRRKININLLGRPRVCNPQKDSSC